MDRNFVAALAVLVLLAGGAMYFLSAAHEREVAGLRGLVEEARRQAAESDRARKAAEDARATVEKVRREGEEVRKPAAVAAQKPGGGEEDALREAEAKKASDAARDAREAARVEAMRLRIEAARKRAEEESARAKDRAEQPKLPEVKLKPPPG